MRSLSELEGVSLGIIYNFQPCTAYFVRGQLKSSPSSHWQASAGSVYPLVARLEELGLLSASEDGDKRGRKYLTVTQTGEQQIKEWVLSGAQQDLVSAIMDPIRTRIAFLQLLDRSEQSQYLNELISLMEQFFDETLIKLQQSPKEQDVYGYLVALGAMQTSEARLNWLYEVRKSLVSK
ncbi:MAG: helix-turn-helix transcriptional regulator [Marinicella sp.]